VFTLDSVVPWGRSLDEYVRMFALSSDDLSRGRILGCADGPASFNAEAAARGARVVSCDPLYQFTATAISERIDATSPSVIAQTQLNAHTFVWTGIASIEELARVRRAAMTTFLDDYSTAARRRAYVAGALPSLPFASDSFALALSSHFLFLYSDHLGERFHVDAALELCRVAADVRVFPLLTLGSQRSPFVEPVMDALARRGLRPAIERVPYEFQRGGNEMMRVSRS
jgi:hypothetical protein